MPSKIRAANLHKSYNLNERYVRNLAADILKIINKVNAAELELIFMDDKSIRKFNKKYRRRDRATDVLSFSLHGGRSGRKVAIGEIMISLDMALSNSKIYGTELCNEITLYIIHGILHLFGYDDETLGEKRKMVKKQNLILDKLCSCKNLSEVLMPQ